MRTFTSRRATVIPTAGADPTGAYEAEVDYEDEDYEWEDAAGAASDDEDEDAGGMTDLEEEESALRNDDGNGDEQATEQMASLSECLAAEQTAYIVRKDLRDIKHYGRERRQSVSGGRGEKKETSNEDRRKRIEESKKKTTCRVCGQQGPWAGDPECMEEKKPPMRKGFGRENRYAGKKGKGKRKSSSTRFNGKTRRSCFAVRDDGEDDDMDSLYGTQGSRRETRQAT